MIGFRLMTSASARHSLAEMVSETTMDPVQNTRMAGSSCRPMVRRYSDSRTLGTAREEQYSTGQNSSGGRSSAACSWLLTWHERC